MVLLFYGYIVLLFNTLVFKEFVILAAHEYNLYGLRIFLWAFLYPHPLKMSKKNTEYIEPQRHGGRELHGVFF